jgi:succinyl-CoA synthetase beta subunit
VTIPNESVPVFFQHGLKIGKVKVNERAINRHPEITDMAAKMISRSHFASFHSNQKNNSLLGSEDTLEMPGKIGILANGKGSVLTTLDAIVNAGGKPGKCVNLRHLFIGDTVSTNFCDRLISSLTSLADDQSSQVILVNFLGTIPQVNQLPEIITKFLQPDRGEITSQIPASNGSKNFHQIELPHLVLRLAGSEFNHVRKYLATIKTSNQLIIVVVVENLDQAVKEAVRLAKLSVVNKGNW